MKEAKTLIDGIFYTKSELINAPKLKSWRCGTESDSPITGKQLREYFGLSQDIDSLPTVTAYPKYKNILGSGSAAICTDTGDILMYDESTDTWNQL